MRNSTKLALGLLRRAGGAAAFVGAYDAIPDIVAAYGMRRLLSSYTGPILRLRRDSDQTEQDFGYTDNGDLDVAAIAAWLGGASGYITTWYDQSGNANHATQTTAARQPLYVAAGQNGRPVARLDGNAWLFVVDDESYKTPDITLFISASRVVSSGVHVLITYPYAQTHTSPYFHWALITDTLGRPIIVWSGRSGYFDISENHAIYTLQDGKVWRDGGVVGGVIDDDLTYPNPAGLRIGSNASGMERWVGDIGEIVLAASNLSIDAMNTAGSNMAQYLGLSWTEIS